MQKSHSLRLWVWFITGAVFFSVVLAGALFIYNEKRYDFEKLTEYYSGIAQRAAHDINGLPNTREGFLSVTQRLMALNGLESLFLLGKTGEVQLISGMQNSTTPQRFAVEHLQRAALVKVVNDFAYIAAPLEVDEAAAADFSAPAYFVLAVQVGTLKEHVQRNVIWLGGGLAVISMLTFAILSVFIGHVVKPVEELRAAINATVQGSGVSKLDISGPAEIRDISVAFNDLVGTLTQREARLNQQRELLEEKIDEVRRSEAKFRESDAWFRGIFNSAMDGMVLIDSQGTIIEANPAAFKLFGYTSADMLGKRIEMLMPTEARAQHQSYLDRYLNTGVGVIIGSNAREVIGLNKKGENFAIDLAVSAIPMRDKTYFLGAVRDVTERRLASQELMRARDLALESARMKDAFLANINHELRTPLNGILGTLQLAEMTGNEEERKSYFDIIRSSGQQLLDTINRVLDFARIDAGTMELEQREFNPLSLLATTVRTLGAAMTKNLYLTYLAPSNLSVHMTTDPIRLRQALTHVIENGIKFTEHGGVVVTVGLVVRDAKTWLEIVIQDTGCGIASQYLSTIFDQFSQFGKAGARGIGGTGLGLSTAKRLTELMGGTLSVQSEVQRGSIFTFQIPVITDMVKPEYTAPPRAKRQVITCIGDAVLRKNLSWYLDMQGFGVDEKEKKADVLLVSVHEGTAQEIATIKYFAQQYPNINMVLLCHPRQAVPAQKLLEDHPGSVLLSPYNGLTLVEQLDAKKAELKPAARVDQPLRVLVVEDNPVNQRVLMAMLNRLGLQHDLAQNGAEAVQKIRTTQYDLVLMDCLMPVIDGYEATRQIRSMNDIRRDVPIIAVTANALEGDRDKCLNVGMNDYLPKPVNLEMLRGALQRWMTLPADKDDILNKLAGQKG